MDPSLSPAPIELARTEAPRQLAPLGNTMLGGLVDIEPVPSLSTVEKFLAIPGMKLATNEGSTVSDVFGGKASILSGVHISGLNHASVNDIERFQADKIVHSGKFGTGTYFGLGNLKGETVEGLQGQFSDGEATNHISSVAGNFLVIERKNVSDVDAAIKASQPVTSRIISRIATNFADNFPHYRIDGKPIDGIVILMSEDEPAAELIVLPASTDKISVRHRVALGERGEQLEERIVLEPRLSKEMLRSQRYRLSDNTSAVVDTYLEGRPQLDTDSANKVLRFVETGTLNEFQRQMLTKTMGSIMDASVGVDQGYTLGEHTQMVLSRFDKQFASSALKADAYYDTNLTDLLRMTLLMQDIGKPIAVEMTGDKSTQSDFNHDFALSYMEGMALGNESKLAVSELVGQDILGTYLKRTQVDFSGKGLGLKEAATGINGLADKLGFSPPELLEVLKILYISDASSYTAQSEYIADDGQHKHGSGLDYIFETDSAGRLQFNAKLSAAFKKLENSLWEQASVAA